MGWGNSRRRRGAAPRYYNLPPPGPGLLIRQASLAYGDSSPAGPGVDTPTPAGGGVASVHANRQRYKIPVYNLTTGQPLPDVKGGTLAVNFDNAVFHSLFPEAELAIVRIPRPPDDATPEESAAHQDRMRELVEQGIEINGQRYHLVLATGARKHGDFLFAHIPYWKKIAPTFEKIMAYGGIMLTACREPPRQFKHLRVLIAAEDGEYGTGDCNAKMADWLFEEFGQQGHRFRAGQFRLLAEREDGSGLVVVGKGTIKRMDHQDVDERGQPYDLILPESFHRMAWAENLALVTLARVSLKLSGRWGLF